MIQRKLLYNIKSMINTLRPRQNGRHFAYDLFKCIYLNENVWISLKISLKFVSRGPVNNCLVPTWRQVIIWTNDRLPTHVYSLLSLNELRPYNQTENASIGSIRYINMCILSNLRYGDIDFCACNGQCSLKFILVLTSNILTRLPLASHICTSESGQHWFR